MSQPQCRHCSRPKVNRPRGLCWDCYYAPGVRDQYPVVDMASNRRGHSNGYRVTAIADEPTTTLPGTAERLAVLEQRAASGMSLWHPRDAKHPL